MGSINDESRVWMPPAPQMLPLGQGNIYPLGGRHPVSVSLPTWDSVIGQSRKEKWVCDELEWAYPRFHINKPVRDLADAVLRRLNITTDTNILCMLFSSPTNARKCATSLREASSDTGNTPESDIIHFYAPADPDSGFKSWSWASFSAVLMPDESWKKAMAFWRDTGSGLSTRHAEFCLEVLDYLSSESSNKEFCTRALRKRDCDSLPQSPAKVEAAEGSVDGVKSILARLATSEKPGQPTVSPDDVFLYPTGMNSIFSLSESLLQLDGDSSVAAFGWLYPETVEVLRAGWGKVLSYKFGTEREYKHLEESLGSGDMIKALFCEIPSNITLYTPDLRRIRALADKYGFIVACDDTVAGYFNIDALPYVDVMISSLTKTFSGASNVTGGSLVLNPASQYHSTLRNILRDNYEKTYFPLDVAQLLTNCQSMAWRVKKCNQNTLPLVKLFASHPTVATVHHPSIEPTSHLYKSVMRKDGGYGNLLSVLFHNSRSAEHFYNILDTCKGSSFGTNFTLAVPYVQLANYWNQDKVERYGVPRHIIRISVGLEDEKELVEVVARALEGVVKFEAWPGQGAERSMCKEGHILRGQ